MADFNAIGAISTTLINLIKDQCPIELDKESIKLYQAGSFKKPSGDMIKGFFSVYLYRVAINGNVRNHSFRREPNGQRFKPSLPVDLYYLITPWANDCEKQHRMLGWVMRMLEDIGTLNASYLNHTQYMAGNDTFLATESVDIICDPLALNDYFTIWDRLGALPLSISYVLRMVMLDSKQPIDDGALVQTRIFELGKRIET